MVWLTAWYSAERCTHSTALRLSSAATSTVAGLVSLVDAAGVAGAAGSVRLQAPSASAVARMETVRTRVRMDDPGCEGEAARRSRRRPSVAKRGDAPMTASR